MGRIRRNPVEMIKRRDGYICAACGFKYITKHLEVHHIQSVESDGDDTSTNLVSLCGLCHEWVPNGRESFLNYCRQGGIVWAGAVGMALLGNSIPSDMQLSDFVNNIFHLREALWGMPRKDNPSEIEEFARIRSYPLQNIDATTAAGRLLMNVLASMAQYEREQISARTSGALQFKKNALRIYGETPFGFIRVGDRLSPEESELITVRRIYSLRQQGLTLRAIAAVLNGEKVRTKKGKKWASATVTYVLQNSIYKNYL